MDPERPSIPGVPGWPVLGNLPELRRNRLDFYERARAAHGNTLSFRAGPMELVLLSEPADVHVVLVERAYDFHKSPSYAYLRALLGSGLLTSEDELHKGQRRLLAPFFTPRRIASLADTFVACAERLTWTTGQEVELVRTMSGLTLDVVNHALFGSALDADARAVGPAFLAFNRWIVDEGIRLLHFPRWLPLRRNREFRALTRTLDRSFERLIERRRGRDGESGDLLSTLLAARDEDGGAMSDAQVRDEALTLMFAGHETTALALSWTFYLLARHPGERLLLEEEVDGVLGGRPPEVADLPRLPRTLRALKETMRLYPPAPSVGRQAQRAVELRGCALEEGRVVVCNIYGIHRRDDLWEDPRSFRPERFADEGTVPAGAYLPFALGPRICIGNHFAMMEAHLLLAHLVQRVRFDLVDPRPVDTRPLVTLHPSRPLRARVTTRH